jgi:putative ABC transport system permease protein
MRRLIFFAQIFIWFSVRNLRRHFGRALIVVLGIALGAAVFTSVRISVHASLESFTRSMEFFAGASEKVLVHPGGYVSEEVIPILQQHPAVSRISPLLTTYVRGSRERGDSFLLIGIDPIMDRSFRRWRTGVEAAGRPETRWPDLIADPYALLVSEALANELGVAPGGRVTLDHTSGAHDFQVLGILIPEELALVEGGRVAITDIATFQEFTGLLGVVDRIDMILSPGTTPQELTQLVAVLPEALELLSPSAARDSGTAMIRAYQLNLSVLSFASLFVGMFLVYSLVALNAASRRRELAVMRSLGASPRLLFQLFLSEGALFGLVGWLVAIPLSTVMVNYLLQIVSRTISTLFVRVQPESLALSPWEVLISFGLTVGVSVLAAYQPAREAMGVAPKEAMEIAQRGVQGRRPPARLVLPALGCIAACIPLSMMPGVAGVPMPGYLAILLLFIGFALLAPWMLHSMGRVLAPGLRRTAGVAAYLAGRYVWVSGTRTSISVGALITAVALFTALVIMIHSFRHTVELWVQQTVSGDLFVTNKMGQVNRYRFPIPDEIAAGLQQLETEADYVPSRRFQLTREGFPYEFEVLEMQTFLRHGGFVWLKGDPETVRPLLARGEGVVVSEVFANRTGLAGGRLFRAQIEGSRVELPVLGVVRDYRTNGGIVFYDWSSFKERFHDPKWSGVRFYMKDRSQDVEAQIMQLRNEIVRRYGDRLDLVSGNELRQSILRIFDETFAVTTVLLFIALVVAALGITTTLSVLVLERSRQLNTMAAVGASFGQIRAMILWEASFLVAAGEIAGLVCGFILSYLLVYVINRQSFGWTFLYTVDWGALALSLPLIVLTALAAAVPATRMVLRQPPATLLKER